MGDQLALFIDLKTVAIWAEEHFFDLELDRLMEYLQRRGAVVVKRAYGDWGRFDRYRDDLLDNSIDLIQMYSIRPGKNRADIRLALDAFETATTRPQIGTIVVVSGDSDLSPWPPSCGNTAGTSWALAPAKSLTRCWSKRATSSCTWRPYSGQSPRPQSPCRRAWRLPTKVYSPRSSRRTWKESRDVLRDIGGVPLA